MQPSDDDVMASPGSKDPDILCEVFVNDTECDDLSPQALDKLYLSDEMEKGIS